MPDAHQPHAGMHPMQATPQVVHIQTRPGGLGRAVGIIAGLCMFGFVFTVGLVLGIAVMFASTGANSSIVEGTWRDGTGRATIAILPVEGVIDGRKAAFVQDAVAHILDSGDFDAVILRVDSPGGGVTASDEIWYEIERLRNAGLPVIASYGGMAASGGYYVSCAADHIIAQPTCVTGSIGVIAQIVTFEGLMEKVGVEPVTLVATGSPNKDVANDAFRSWNERDRAKVISSLDASYETFIDRVATGRASKLDVSEARSLADGSIYQAQEAVVNKLIDGIGYLDDAITITEQRLGVAVGSADVIRLGWPPQLLGGWLIKDTPPGSTSTSTRLGDMTADDLRTFVNELASPRIMYLGW